MGALASRNEETAAAATDTGVVTFFGVDISRTEHWVEDGVHYIRSTEFDCYAADEDFHEAVVKFGETCEDLLEYIGDLVREGDAMENEVEVFALLAPRMIEAYRRERDELERRRRVLINKRRRRRRRRSHWAPLTTPGSSSRLSPV